jgi:hypothetical protein
MGLDQNIFLEVEANRLPNEKHDEDLIYWRKCYVIHNWLDNRLGGVDNCAKHYLEKEDIEDLISFCMVLGIDEGNGEQGFWEMEEKGRTIKALKKILKDIDFNKQRIYYWAWW